MVRRIEQINELLKSELAKLILEKINISNGLITVSYVDCAPDLKRAKIGISILPEKYFGTTLNELKRQSRLFSQIIRKKTKLRQVPKFIWQIDNTETKAAEIEKLLKEIK